MGGMAMKTKLILIGLQLVSYILIGFIQILVSSNDRAYAASVIYSNLGSGGSFACCSGWAVNGPAYNLPGPSWLAFAFTPNDNGNVSQIDVALTYGSGTNAVTVSLLSDNSGVLGTTLGAWSLQNIPPVLAPRTGTLQTISVFPPNIHLTGGDTYWLQVAVGGDNSNFAWNDNPTGVTGMLAQPGGYRTTFGNPIGAFDILGVPQGPPFVTPLPGALPLFATGLGALGLLGWRRKRKAGCRT